MLARAEPGGQFANSIEAFAASWTLLLALDAHLALCAGRQPAWESHRLGGRRLFRTGKT